MNPGTLYLIPATLGDLKSASAPSLLEWSLPAQVRAVAARLTCFGVENAKSARAFLKLVGTQRPLQELEIFEFGHQPDDNALKPLVDKLLRGTDVGVLSEAGCPGIADPGAQLARLAHAANVRVAPLTGPSSILLALMAAGLDGQRFAFAGYAPVKSPAREDFIRKLEARSAREHETQIVIETPYRNDALWAALLATLSGKTRLTRAAGLTLPEESVQTQSVSAWQQRDGTQPVGAQYASDAARAKLPTVFLFLAA